MTSAAVAMGGVMTGCGGSSSSVTHQTPTVSATGGVAAQNGTSATGASQSAAPQQVQVTRQDGSTVTATVPPGESFAAGTPVNVIPANQPFINGLSLAPKTRAQGDVTVDGQASGVHVNPDGSLDQNLILTAGTHQVDAQGPFNVSDGTNTLTVGNFRFVVLVLPNGNSSLPVALNMRIPANGGSTENGNFVNVTFATPDFMTGQANLVVSWPGTNKNQTRPFNNGVANFADLSPNRGDTIPNDGVSYVQFGYRTQ